MTERPTDRPRRERVFARSGGVCQRCGEAITIDTFHESHLRARANGGIDHESNLEAWCPRCNLTFGARDAADPRLAPREWQLAALDPVVGAIARTGAATVSAAPGAGKTVFAGLVFEQLREMDLVDRMLVLVPRRGLVDQWVEALAVARHLELKPHSAIERRGQLGAVVTYQSLGNRDALEAHRLQANRGRTLLVLDEVHHVGQRPDGHLPAWARNVAELAGDVDAHDLHVASVLNLSGTLWRSLAGERISTVRYRTIEEGRLESLVDFEVAVAELVAAGELRPIDLYRLGAHVRLADYQNLEHVEGNLSDLDEKPARAAMAELSSVADWRSTFVTAVLDRLEVAHRALDGYHAKALIVAALQDDARKFRDEVDRQMQARGLKPLASLAITDEPEAQRTLEHFRAQRRVGVLCTVDMAGEGYDCPEIAVIGYASNKLTALYVRQVTARAMRVTGRERQLGRVIPAAVVLPDANELVAQLVAYLAPFTHEVLVPSDEELERRSSREPAGTTPLFTVRRFSLEDARPAEEDIVTVAYADGSHEDIDAALAQRLALELERLNVPGIYAPRAVAASRRTVGDLLESRPFDRLGADAAVLERLATGAEAVAEAEATHLSTIEDQASILMEQLDRWAKWWAVKGDPQTPVSYFNQAVNQAGGISGGRRGSASVEQLRRARDWARTYIGAYCEGNDVAPPRGWRTEGDAVQ